MFATSFLPPPLLPFSTTSITTSFYHSPVCVTSPSQNPLVTILTFLNPFHHSDTDKALPPHVNRRTEDDGLKSRLAARRSRTSRRALAPTKRRARRVVRPLDVVSLRAFGLPETYIYQLLAAAGRRTRSTPVASALPYDLQRALFDELVPPRRTVPTSPPSPGWAAASWRFVADTARFLTVQGGGWAGKKRGVTAVDAVAMAHDTAAAEDWEGNSAAAAYAAAAAIANSSSDATLDDTELAGLTAGVAAARAVATVDDAAVFVDTVGVAPLVTAARLLPGTERAAALTALANIAIMLPEFRSHMLRVEKGCIVKTLADIVTRSGHFKVPTAVGGMSSTEALVSGTHLLGSLALAKGRLGAEWRNKMALDADLVRSLQRLAGGLKNGEPEGAARAARRALGTLGINHWRPRMPGQRGLRILCIDGGGTRAIMAFEMLKELKRTTGCEIHELFDIIGGTSTGAILAASIGITHKTVEDVELLYRDMIGKIFAKHPVNGPKMLLTRAYYDTSVLESTLQRECGKGVFIDSLAEENMNRVFVVSSIMSRNPKELHVFRNYTYPVGHESRYDGTAQAQLWEGLRASSAAPTFFSEIRVNGELHADGAIVANNPTAVALHETKCVYPGVPIELVVSLGNGRAYAEGESEDADEKKNMGWGDVVGSIVASATSTETVHHAVQDLFPKDKYFRFNPLTDSTQIDETHPETLASFVREAQNYIAGHREDFEEVTRILRPKTPRSLWRRFRDALGKEMHELQNSAWDDDLYLPN